MSADGVDNVRAVIKSKNATGASFQWQLAIQYAATRVDNPDAPTTLDAQQTGSAERQTGDVAITTAAKRLFRLGIAYSSAVAGVQQGDVGLQASWKQVGTDLGKRRVTVNAVDSGTKYEVLTAWMPATIMAKVKAAFILTSVTGLRRQPEVSARRPDGRNDGPAAERVGGFGARLFPAKHVVRRAQHG